MAGRGWDGWVSCTFVSGPWSDSARGNEAGKGHSACGRGSRTGAPVPEPCPNLNQRKENRKQLRARDREWGISCSKAGYDDPCPGWTVEEFLCGNVAPLPQSALEVVSDPLSPPPQCSQHAHAHTYTLTHSHINLNCIRGFLQH